MTDVSPVQTSRQVDDLLKNVLKRNKSLSHSVDRDLDAEEVFYKTFGENRFVICSSLKVRSSLKFVKKGKLTGEAKKKKKKSENF